MSGTLRFVDRLLRSGALKGIGFYRRFLSRFLGGQCRFYPSCSEYAREAFEKRCFAVALWLATKRLAKCHPFHPGGYDPLDPDDAPGDDPRSGDENGKGRGPCD